MEHSRVATCKQDIINTHQKIKDISAIRQDKQRGVNLGGKKTNGEQKNHSYECTMPSVLVSKHTMTCAICTHEMGE